MHHSGPVSKASLIASTPCCAAMGQGGASLACGAPPGQGQGQSEATASKLRLATGSGAAHHSTATAVHEHLAEAVWRRCDARPGGIHPIAKPGGEQLPRHRTRQRVHDLAVHTRVRARARVELSSECACLCAARAWEHRHSPLSAGTRPRRVPRRRHAHSSSTCGARSKS